MKYTFPSGFCFGAATSAHQVEGNNINDWTVWEKQTAELQCAAAKRKTWPEHLLRAYPNPLQKENYISGKAAGHYERFEKDFHLARDLGHNAHRLSIEWSRVEPEEGVWNQRELAHYKKVLETLRSNFLEPFVTLWHWTLPLWLARRGGVLANEFPRYFTRYATRMAQEFGSHVRFWITVNEPEVYALNAYYQGVWPPQKTSLALFLRARRALIKAHRHAYSEMKQQSPQAHIGASCNLSYFESAGGAFNTVVAYLANHSWNHGFLRPAASRIDFIGLNYYFHNRINHGFNKNENKLASDVGWELYPAGINAVLQNLVRYKKPIYITENGLADARDTHRAWFIEQTLDAVAASIQSGADVRGYFHWSLLDNFEWDKGFWPRFGLIAVDYKTLARTARPSAYAYQSLIKRFS